VDDGLKAIKAVEEDHYDLVLMDCMMPIMSGQEATQVIRSTVAKERQPIIVALTADAFVENEERCREIGMEHFLQKPVDKKKLEQVLHKYSVINV
jgi:CheY-like chemotaxis protein